MNQENIDARQLTIQSQKHAQNIAFSPDSSFLKASSQLLFVAGKAVEIFEIFLIGKNTKMSFTGQEQGSTLNEMSKLILGKQRF